MKRRIITDYINYTLAKSEVPNMYNRPNKTGFPPICLKKKKKKTYLVKHSLHLFFIRFVVRSIIIKINSLKCPLKLNFMNFSLSNE